MFGLGHLWDPGFYNTKTGAVFYDANGSGGGAADQFASLTGVPALTYQDFVLFQLIFETPEPVKLAQAVDCQWRRQIVPDGGVKVYRSG